MSSHPRTTRSAAKRDSLAAELERDPQHSTAKRQARSATLTSSLASASLSREVLTLKTAKIDLETKLREKDAVIEKLEGDRRWLSEREKEEREARIAENAENSAEKKKLEDDLRTLRTNLSGLQEQLADLKDIHSELSLSSSRTISTQKSHVSSLTQQLSALHVSLDESRRLAEDRGMKVRELEDRLESSDATKPVKEESNDDWTVLNKQLQQTTSYLQELESANAKMNTELSVLRERHASLEVLREEKRGLEAKMRGMEQMREKIIGLEAQLDIAKKKSTQQVPTPESQTLLALRRAHAKLLEEQGLNISSLASLERANAELSGDVEKLSAELVEVKQQLNERDMEIRRREGRWDVGEREVRGLKALLASYTAERSLDAESSDMHTDDAQLERIQQLEMMLEEYKSSNRQLEREIQNLSGGSSSGSGKSWRQLSEQVERLNADKFELQQALKTSESETSSHLAQIESLSQQLFDLGGEIAGGRHVPPGTRILSLKDNPAQVWADTRQAVLDRLRDENEALLKRLGELQDRGHDVSVAGEAGGDRMVPRESWELVSKERDELEETVKQKEKRLLRLQQVFTSKSAEFREAIASILGLKLAFYPNGQVRVTSIYDLAASFVFQPTSKDTEGMRMQLVAQGEGGPQDLEQTMQYWIEGEECIPGFMASVTLECWDMKKREARR